MKQLIAGVVLIIVVGIGGFLYRNVLERNAIPQPEGVACTMDAKLCPDGSAVGRSGPSCTFAPCALPNIELDSLGASFVLPQGYTPNPDALGSDATLIGAYEKPALGEPPHAIVVRRYPIPAGESAADVILRETMLEPSGMTPDSIADFETVLIAGKEFKSMVVERFEAQVHSVYYLVRSTDVLRFEVLERDVVAWTEPSLSIPELPEHTAFRDMLTTLQVR